MQRKGPVKSQQSDDAGSSRLMLVEEWNQAVSGMYQGNRGTSSPRARSGIFDWFRLGEIGPLREGPAAGDFHTQRGRFGRSSLEFPNRSRHIP